MRPDAGAAGDPRRPRRPGTLLVTAAAAVLLVGGGTVAAVGLAGRDAEPPPSLSAADASPAPAALAGRAAPATPPPASPAPSPAAAAPSEPAATPAVVPDPAPLPVEVSIPSIGVTSALLHLGLQEDGSLEVPQGEDFDTAAWYDGSPRPGDVGPAVLEGHVSSRARGPSVFYDLARLQVGERVDVRREDGSTVTFEVYDLQQFPKDGFPTLEVYGNTVDPELRIITCGGTIADSGHYTDNVIVFARLVQG